jgi:hypothetical protein
MELLEMSSLRVVSLKIIRNLLGKRVRQELEKKKGMHIAGK